MIAPAAFERRDGQLAIDLPGGHVVFSTRSGGDLSAPGGASAALLALVPAPPGRWLQDRQVHGTEVRTTTGEAALAPWTRDADAQVTTLTGAACVVRVADCIPLALVAPEAVAAVHGGWRGLAGGIVEAAVAALRAQGATRIAAAIGPGAGVCCYEAGDEVHAAFAADGPAARRGRHADLKAVAAGRLRASGVEEIHDTGICTICAAPGELYSHRRGDRGRQGVIAWRS